MKNKIWIIGVLISSCWLLITSTMYVIFGAMGMFALPEHKDMLYNILTDDISSIIIGVISIGSIITSSIIITYFSTLYNSAKDLDDLDVAKQKYYDARETMLKHIDKLK